MTGHAHAIESLLGPLNEPERKHAPTALHAAGRVEVLRQRPRIAVVGTPHPTAEGVNLAARAAAAIAQRDGVVVGGLVEGIGVAAHRGALAAGGNTVAVLAGPISRAAPTQNRALRRRLMEEQLVLSQFAPGHDGGPGAFLQRNRTIALVSDAVVILEAGARSGAQVHGWEALRLGRTLYLPRYLATASFPWPRRMMHHGAVVFEDLNQLLALLDLDFLLVAPDADAARSPGSPG